jgi:hypothetical protein
MKTIGMFQIVAGLVGLGTAVFTNDPTLGIGNLAIGVGVLGLGFLVTGYYNVTK